MEEEAYNSVEKSGNYNEYCNSVAIISIAVSLKRIADAVTLPNIGPESQTISNIAELISGIEMNTRG